MIKDTMEMEGFADHHSSYGHPIRRRPSEETKEYIGSHSIPLHEEHKDLRSNTRSKNIVWGSILLALIVTYAMYRVLYIEPPRSDRPATNGGDAKICAFMPTKRSDGLNLLLAVSSLLTSESPEITVILINNDRPNDGATEQWMSNVGSTVNKMYKRNYVAMANISRSNVDKAYPAFRDNFQHGMSYGYVMVDMLFDKVSGLECEYFMVTSPRNIYNTEFIPTLLRTIKAKDYDLIGWEYIAQKHVSTLNNADRSHRSGYGQQIYTQFKPGYIEHGGAILKRSSFIRAKMSFLLRSMDNKGNLKANFDHKTVDVETFTQFASRKGITSYIIERSLMMQNEES